MNRVYVVTHKDFDDSILNDLHQVIKVGNHLTDGEVKEKGWISDNNGDNISHLNPYYCELTAMYYIWKNIDMDENDIIGLAHYRRLFFCNKKNSKTWKENILNNDDINLIMNEKDAILPYERKKKKRI